MMEQNAALSHFLGCLVEEYRREFAELPPEKLEEVIEPVAQWLLEISEPKSLTQ